MTRPNLFAGDVARHYDADCADVSTPAVLGPTFDLLADLAGAGPVLEFALGTGRVALPLSERVDVHGIEYSADMLAQLRAKPGAERITAHEGDMTTTRVPGQFSLVYPVFNTIGNLTTKRGGVPARVRKVTTALGLAGRTRPHGPAGRDDP